MKTLKCNGAPDTVAENGTSLRRFLLQVCGKRKLVYIQHSRLPCRDYREPR